MCAAAFLQYQKEDRKAPHFQRQPLLSSVFSWSPEWESSDITIPLIYVCAEHAFSLAVYKKVYHQNTIS